MQQEKTIVIDIKLSHGLLWILVSIALLSTVLLYLTLSERPAEASFEAQATGQRQYYLTKDIRRGLQADLLCTTGYHMASMWEIADPSNLLYNTTLGKTDDDSGSGPAAGAPGWVHTGFIDSTSSIAGHGNCNGWTSLDGTHYGTTATLPDTWTSAEDLGVWDVTAQYCDYYQHVWCIED